MTSMQPHLYSKEWVELESDPGVFTLLCEELGAEGVAVEEIWDCDEWVGSKAKEGNVFGLIMLFRWRNRDRRSRRLKDCHGGGTVPADVAKQMFFARQVIPNSCATLALLHVLLNNDSVKVGPVLRNYKEKIDSMDPREKGRALRDVIEIVYCHNRHGRIERNKTNVEKGVRHIITSSGAASDQYHFVCFIPYMERVLEIDGLKEAPIDHGPWTSDDDWYVTAARVARERMLAADGAIHFSLMAVIKDRRVQYGEQIDLLLHNREKMIDPLAQVHYLSRDELLLTARKGLADSDSAGTKPRRSYRKEIQGLSAEEQEAVQKERDIVNGVTLTLQSQEKTFMVTQSTRDKDEKVIVFPSSVEGVLDLLNLKIEVIPTESASDLVASLQESIKAEPDSSSPLFSAKAIMRLLINATELIEDRYGKLQETMDEHDRYLITDSRRRHDYSHFIEAALRMLGEQGHLENPIEQEFGSFLSKVKPGNASGKPSSSNIRKRKVSAQAGPSKSVRRGGKKK